MGAGGAAIPAPARQPMPREGSASTGGRSLRPGAAASAALTVQADAAGSVRLGSAPDGIGLAQLRLRGRAGNWRPLLWRQATARALTGMVTGNGRCRGSPRVKPERGCSCPSVIRRWRLCRACSGLTISDRRRDLPWLRHPSAPATPGNPAPGMGCSLEIAPQRGGDDAAKVAGCGGWRRAAPQLRSVRARSARICSSGAVPE